MQTLALREPVYQLLTEQLHQSWTYSGPMGTYKLIAKLLDVSR